MEMSGKKAINLYRILENLVDNLEITDQELSMTMEYIFNGGSKPSYAIANNELSEQVSFLHQLVEDRAYKTVEDLEEHFVDLRSWAEGLNESSVCNSNVRTGIFISYSLANQKHIQQLQDFLNEELSDKLVFNAKSTILNDAWSSTIERHSENLIFHKRDHVRLFTINARVAEFSKLLSTQNLTTLNTVTGLGCNVYLKQFAAQNQQETYIQFTQKKEFVKQLPFNCSKKLLLDNNNNHTCHIEYTHQFENILGLSYEKFMNIVTFEKDIKSDILKKSLGIWMAFSKYRHENLIGYCKDILRYSKQIMQNRKYFEESYHQFSIQYQTLIETLVEKKWKILKSPVRHSWITTENPGISIMDFGSKDFMHIMPDTFWHKIRKDSLEYFPLSGSYCLRLEPLNSENSSHDDQYTLIKFEQTNDKEVDVVNALARKTNPIALISSSKKELRKEIALVKNIHPGCDT